MVLISEADEITTCCNNNLRTTHHCHYTKKSNLFDPQGTHLLAACTIMTRFHLHTTSPADPEDLVVAIRPATVPPSPACSAGREMDLGADYGIVNISCSWYNHLFFIYYLFFEHLPVPYFGALSPSPRCKEQS